MSHCGCDPGTHDNGWHETRSPRCWEADRQAWREAMRKGREFAMLLRSEVSDDVDGVPAGADR